MKKLNLLFSIFFLVGFLEAKINITGIFVNTKNITEQVNIFIYKGGVEKNIGSVTLNKDGGFSFSSETDYTGLLFLKTDKIVVELVTDNSPIFFEYDLDSNHFISLKSDLNILFQSGSFNVSKETIATNLKKMLSFYNPINNKDFSKSLKNEITRLEKLNVSKDYEKYPFLNYFFNLSEKVNNFSKNNKNLKEASVFFESTLKNDNSFLENSGLLKNVLIAYYTSELSGVTDRSKVESKLDSLTTKLLDNVVCESSRGQNILESSLELFKNSQIDTLYKKYLVKAEKLTCTIQNEKLKTLIASTSIKVGSKATDYKFITTLNKKASLHEFKSKNKILVFYASWCGHCVKEMPKVIELYKNKKNKGVEFFLISLDDKKADYENFIKDFPNWNNYSELAGFESKIAKDFAIEGTPTIFLLDENNTIKAISHNIEDIKKELL